MNDIALQTSLFHKRLMGELPKLGAKQEGYVEWEDFKIKVFTYICIFVIYVS